jgi:isochorismate synthase
VNNQGFAVYRKPYAEACTVVTGAVTEYASFSSLSRASGFVLAPFAPSPAEPLLVIGAERMVMVASADDVPPLPDFVAATPSLADRQSVSRQDYHIDFSNFHARLSQGEFQKLVLSRSIVMAADGQLQPLQLFQRACCSYPRMFIALVYTPQSGLWLTATPELLLGGSGSQWQTIALAGTMPYADHLEWSDKNRQEQRYVATYIMRQLEQFADRIDEEGPYTARAGHLAHLRSDFRFLLRQDGDIGRLLQALHPTPAVCGLPKQEAFQFILQQEHHRRSYYSGFMGPLLMEGHTALFVTLRCMQLFADCYRLYAGGGILTDSDEEQEWQETETKLDTMRNVLNHKG